MRRKNNIFFSAFVLIATFAFMLSPLSVVAASSLATNTEISESQCTAQGGTVKTNFYLFLTGGYVGTNIDTGLYNSLFPNNEESKEITTAKTFNLGLIKEADQLIGHGRVSLDRGTTDSQNGLDSWSLATFYRIFLNAHESSTEVTTDGDRSYAMAAVWYDETGQETNRQTDLSTTVSEDVAATYNQDSSINSSLVTIRKGETGQFKITRTYTKAAFKTAESTVNGNVFHPAVYYVQFCNVPDGAGGGGDTTPTSTGFTVYYDPNGGVNAPEKQPSPDAKPVTISSTKPSKQGNTFLGWSEDKNATEPDSKYAAGQVYRGPNDITLYAVWSPKTGVSDYLMATAIIAGVAGLGLFVSRRKKLFKQI